MKSIQRVGRKNKTKRQVPETPSGARFVVIRPAGFPLKSVFHDYPEVSEIDVFEFYARLQWGGVVAKRGDYLFDKRMFPDFAFEIVDAEPDNSVIGDATLFLVDDYNTIVPELSSDTKFDEIIGQNHAKQKCRLIERFLESPEKFGRWAPRNVLFYGPSGTGKTMMAKALSNETKAPLLPVKATRLIGDFVGDGSRQIHNLYEHAEELQPCIVFIDELDAIALDRRFQELRGDVVEVVNALLTEMDGIMERKGVCTIAATNRIESLDPAVRNRFEEEIEFKLPSAEERLAILMANAATFPQKIDADVKWEAVAKQTAGFSGRDLVEKVLKAALHSAIIEDSPVKKEHIESALRQASPKTSEPPKGMFM